MREVDVHFWAATALMIVGTFMFFWSVAGFAIFALTHAKGVYLRGIRMFTTRQIASKVNTAFVSMSVVCVMLFFALTTASVGMGLLELFAGNIEQVTRYDASIWRNLRIFPMTLRGKGKAPAMTVIWRHASPTARTSGKALSARAPK